MEKWGYIRNLYTSAKELGFNIIEWKLADYCMNPMNPTGILVIKKDPDDSIHNDNELFVCPITHTALRKKDGIYYSDDALLGYPIFNDVACLLSDYAIVATHFNDFNN